MSLSESELTANSQGLIQNQPAQWPSSAMQSASTESLLRIAVYGSGKQRRQALAMLPPNLRHEAQQSRREQAWTER